MNCKINQSQLKRFLPFLVMWLTGIYWFGFLDCTQARDIVDRESALLDIDKYVDYARKNVNNPSELRTALETFLAEVMDHPKVFDVLEYAINKSTNPGCVSLALTNLVYSYFNWDNPYNISKKPTIPNAHDKRMRRDNTLRLLKLTLNSESIVIRSDTACTSFAKWDKLQLKVNDGFRI